MKLKLFLVTLALALVIAPIALAMETQTYQFTASSNGDDVVVPITTYRTGDISVSADYRPNNHGMYVIWILDANGGWLCHSTYDFRWGRTPQLPQTCLAPNQPAGSYSVVFRAAMGGKLAVNLSATAETNP